MDPLTEKIIMMAGATEALADIAEKYAKHLDGCQLSLAEPYVREVLASAHRFEMAMAEAEGTALLQMLGRSPLTDEGGDES